MGFEVKKVKKGQWDVTSRKGVDKRIVESPCVWTPACVAQDGKARLIVKTCGVVCTAEVGPDFSSPMQWRSL